MKNLSRIALAAGACTLFASSFASASSDLPNGTYGDPNVATFVETSSGATIEWACEGAEFEGAIRLESGNTFEEAGYYGSSLAPHSDWTPVLMSGKLNEGGCTSTGVCFPHSITVQLTNLKTGKKIGTWTFIDGDTGVTIRCG
jgi:hypothetical protein